MLLPELLDRLRVTSVKNAAIGQNHTHAGERAITVLRRTTTHAAGIVGGNAANFGGVDGGGVWSDLALKRCQITVGMGTNDTGLQAYFTGIGVDFLAIPPIPQLDQYGIGYGLA